MGYKLKPGYEDFTIVDGLLAGAYYKKGYEYPTAPAGYESRFEQVGGYEEDAEATDISKMYGRKSRKTGKTEAEEAEAAAEAIPATESIAGNNEVNE